MITRQRPIIWAWVALIVLTSVCPPWHRGSYSLEYSPIFLPPYHATIDLPRLLLEWIVITVLLGGLYFTLPIEPLNGHLKFPRVHLSRRGTIGLFSTAAVAAGLCGVWGLSRISRALPPEEVAQLDGLCSTSFGTFSGEIHNGSQLWTIRQLTIRLTLREMPVVDVEKFEEDLKKYGATIDSSPPPPGAKVFRAVPQMQVKSRDYQIQDLWIPPLQTRRVSVAVLSPPDSEFLGWKPIAAKGFKNYWYGIKGNGVPFALSSGTESSQTAEPLRTAEPRPAPKPVQVLRRHEPLDARSPEIVFHAKDLQKNDPCANTDPNSIQNRPQNESFDELGNGHGKFSITNGNSEDAAVILAATNDQVGDRLIYIRAGMSATMDGIPVGEYRILFQIGANWDDSAEAFKCVRSTGMFDRIATFEERVKPDSIEYSEISITLHKLIGGNARSTAIAQSQFHRRGMRE